MGRWMDGWLDRLCAIQFSGSQGAAAEDDKEEEVVMPAGKVTKAIGWGFEWQCSGEYYYGKLH